MNDGASKPEFGATPGIVVSQDDVILEALERELDEGPKRMEKLEGRDLSPAELEYERNWITKVCEEIDVRLRRDHAMLCRAVQVESRGFGYRFHCYDRDGRQFIIDYKTEWALDLPSAKAGGEGLGREMIADILKKVLEARDNYMARMVS